MRGDLPLPPIPGQTVGGGVPDAPRSLPLTAIPRAATRGGVKTPPYKPTRKPPPTLTPGPGMPGPYRTAARERLPVSTPQCFHIPIRRAGCPHPAATSRRRQHPGRDYSPCLPPRGKVAPQGRMRGDLPLPPIPGQTVGGGVPDAPRSLPLTAIPRAATRGGVKTPPYKPTRKPPPTLTPGPGMPGPYRTAARERLLT